MKELKEYTAAQTALHEAIDIPFYPKDGGMSIVIDLTDCYWFIEDNDSNDFYYCKDLDSFNIKEKPSDFARYAKIGVDELYWNARNIDGFGHGFFISKVIKENLLMFDDQNAHAFNLLQMLDPKKELRYNESKEVFELMGE